MKKILFTLLLLLTTVAYSQSFVPATIDSAGTISDSLDLDGLFIKSVTVDTPYTTADLSFLKYDEYKDAWYTVKDDGGNAVTITVTDPPANYNLSVSDSWLLTGKVKLVSSTAQDATRVFSVETTTLR